MKKKNKFYDSGLPKGSFGRMVRINQCINRVIDYKEKLRREEERRVKLLQKAFFDIPIRSIAVWSIRVLNCFGRAKIETLGDLSKYDISLNFSWKTNHILSFRNFGKRSLVELRSKLSDYFISALFPGKGAKK